MDQKCPKCSFERELDADECPKCRIIYDKYLAYIEKKKIIMGKNVPDHTTTRKDNELSSDLLNLLDFVSDITD